MDWASKTRLAAFNQKFDLISESHWFSYEIFILRGDIAQIACPYIYALGSTVNCIQRHNLKLVTVIGSFPVTTPNLQGNCESVAGDIPPHSKMELLWQTESRSWFRLCPWHSVPRHTSPWMFQIQITVHWCRRKYSTCKWDHKIQSEKGKDITINTLAKVSCLKDFHLVTIFYLRKN